MGHKFRFEIETHGYVYDSNMNSRYEELPNVIVSCQLLDDRGEVIDSREELAKDLDDSLHNSAFEDLEGFELSQYEDELSKIVDQVMENENDNKAHVKGDPYDMAKRASIKWSKRGISKRFRKN